MSTKYKFKNPDGLYFISTATVYWIDVFTRRLYKDIVIDSVNYCVKEKGLIVHAFVIMSNHIHLIVGKRQDERSFSDILRDFRKFTAMNLIKAIRENQQESRKEWMLWMLWMFERAGKENGNNTKYQFWHGPTFRQDNHPVELEGDWIDQKLEYVHNNPLEAGWVGNVEDYYYSSARNYSGLESPLKIESIYDGVSL